MLHFLKLRDEVLLTLTIRIVVRLLFTMDFENLVFHKRVNVV